MNRYSGPNHAQHDRSSPYPTSRLAPAVSLVDVAAQIECASETIAHQTSAQLQLIATQIRHLQEQARRLLDKAQSDLELHAAECRFQKMAGKFYHLYAKPDGSLTLSLLSPDDYAGRPPHSFLGSYRLEPDQTWTPERELEERDAQPLDLRLLTGSS